MGERKQYGFSTAVEASTASVVESVENPLLKKIIEDVISERSYLQALDKGDLFGEFGDFAEFIGK